MKKPTSFDLIFIVASALLGVVACLAMAWALVAATGWYLDSCPGTAGCDRAKLLMDYWWLVFVPAALVSAWALRRVYDSAKRRQTARSGLTQ